MWPFMETFANLWSDVETSQPPLTTCVVPGPVCKIRHLLFKAVGGNLVIYQIFLLKEDHLDHTILFHTAPPYF